MSASAVVRLSPSGRAFIRSEGAGGLRRLQQALNRAGVKAEPDGPGLLVDLSSLAACRSALEGWTLKAGPEVDAAEAQASFDLAWHSEALSVARTLAADPLTAAESLAGYARVSDLDPHQVTAVAIASHPIVKGLCVFDEQGLGKTVEALFSFDRLRDSGLAGRALVFAPKNMVLEWVHDLQRFFGGKYRGVAVVGDEREKRAALDGPGDLYVTNFETALQLEIRLKQLLQAERGLGLLIVDESFFVKNADARRTKALRRLRGHAGRCLVLCGTPAPNSALDLVEQFNIADGGQAFSGVDVPEDPSAARQVIGSTIEARGVYLRRLKGAVMPDLPHRTFNRVLVPMVGRQSELYRAGRDGLLADLLATDEEGIRRNLASFSARRAALLQLCSNPAAVDPDYAETPAKVEALDRILEDLIGRRGEKVVLWSFFTASLELLAGRYAPYGAVRIDGTVTATADRREAVRRFQDDDRTMLFIGNPAAAGAGLTLHRARFSVYESMSNQAAHYLQSLDRIHRRGQTRPVEYVVLLCDQTIEEAEYDRLLRKEAEAQELLGDDIRRPPLRETFIAELLGRP